MDKFNKKKAKCATDIVEVMSQFEDPEDHLEIYLHMLIKFYLLHYDNDKDYLIEIVSELYDGLEEQGNNMGII